MATSSARSADYDRDIQIHPKHPFALGHRADAYFIHGDPARAIKDYDQAIRIDSKNFALYIRRGEAFRATGDDDRAGQDFDRANPRSREVSLGLRQSRPPADG